MRIIAGQRRGHKIDGPSGRDLRPTSDMVREAIFNILRGDVEGRTVVDLFAGTGALGLEALSRGAVRGIFIERNREAAALVRRNLAALRYEDRGTVVVADVYRWVGSFRPTDDTPLVVFLDPPYREFEGRNARKAHQLIADLLARLPEGSTLVIESGTELGEAVLPDRPAWDLRRYGGTHLAIRELVPDDTVESGSEASATAGSEGIQETVEGVADSPG